MHRQRLASRAQDRFGRVAADKSCKSAFLRDRGFSLVELIVAMAIFLVLLGGLGVLYSNALQTVVFGYQQQEGFEKARASLKVLERDLQSAFTSRDFGDAYDFYGAREGFAFVGVLNDGKVGRVTYALHPTADSKQFTTSFGALYRDLHRLALDQGFPVEDLLRGVADQFPGGTILPGPNDLVPLPSSTGYNDAPWSTLIEFDQIIVETGAIVRYQEDLTNLDTFVVAKPGAQNASNPASYYRWPRIDPVSPARDVPGDSSLINSAVLSAIDPLGSIDPPVAGLDLRNLAAVNRGFLGRLGPPVIEAMVRAGKRETWIQLVAENLPPGPPGPQLFWGDGSDLRPRADYHVLVEDIVLRAYSPDVYYIDPNDAPPVYMNLIDIPPAFAYKPEQDPEKGAWWSSFNSLESLPGYTAYVNALESDEGDINDLVRLFDGALVQTAGMSDTEVGTPLAPKLPSYVRVQFWVALPPKFTTNREFRRWFVEEFVVPSAIGRGTVATLTRRERT